MKFLTIICGGSKSFLKNLWGYETIKLFCRFFHELHNDSAYRVLQFFNIRSLKLVMKNPMGAFLLQMKELLAWVGTCHSGSKFGPIILPIFVKM